jgi:hypothetical protein
VTGLPDPSEDARAKRVRISTWVVVGIFLAALTTYIVVRPPYVEVYVGPKGEIVPTSPTTTRSHCCPDDHSDDDTSHHGTDDHHYHFDNRSEHCKHEHDDTPEPDHNDNDPKFVLVEHHYDNRRYLIDDILALVV